MHTASTVLSYFNDVIFLQKKQQRFFFLSCTNCYKSYVIMISIIILANCFFPQFYHSLFLSKIFRQNVAQVTPLKNAKKKYQTFKLTAFCEVKVLEEFPKK